MVVPSKGIRDIVLSIFHCAGKVTRFVRMCARALGCVSRLLVPQVRVTLDSPLVGFAMPPPEAMGQGGSGSNAPLADKHFWDSFLSRGLSRRAKGQEYHQPFPFAVLELKVSALQRCNSFFLKGAGGGGGRQIALAPRKSRKMCTGEPVCLRLSP